MGLSFVAVLLVMRWLSHLRRRLVVLRALAPLTVCALSIIVITIWNPDESVIRRVGSLKPGLPHFTAGSWLPLLAPWPQLRLAIVLCLLDTCETVSMARTLAAAHGEEPGSPGAEFRAMGLANLAGAAFSASTAAGSFSRSAVASAVGARSPLAAVVTGTVLVGVLAFLTPLFTALSSNAQGAIVAVGALQLLDFRAGKYLFLNFPQEAVVWCAALFTVLLLGVEYGVLVAASLSIVLLLARVSNPPVSTGTSNTLPSGLTVRSSWVPTGTLVLTIQGPLIFASAQPVRKQVMCAIREGIAGENDNLTPYALPQRTVIVDLTPVPCRSLVPLS